MLIIRINMQVSVYRCCMLLFPTSVYFVLGFTVRKQSTFLQIHTVNWYPLIGCGGQFLEHGREHSRGLNQNIWPQEVFVMPPAGERCHFLFIPAILYILLNSEMHLTCIFQIYLGEWVLKLHGWQNTWTVKGNLHIFPSKWIQFNEFLTCVYCFQGRHRGKPGGFGVGARRAASSTSSLKTVCAIQDIYFSF